MQIIPCRADRFLKSQDSDLLEPIVVPAVDNESQIIVADQADRARVYNGTKIDGTQGHLHWIIEPDADIADDIRIFYARRYSVLRSKCGVANRPQRHIADMKCAACAGIVCFYERAGREISDDRRAVRACAVANNGEIRQS